MLDEAVQQGRLTQEQADRMAGRADGNPGWFGGFKGKTPDGKRDFKKDTPRPHDDMAAALGVTPEQLKSELESGKKLPQIISEHGLTAEQFKQKLLEIRKEALSKAVSEGKITQEQADRMIQKMEKRPDRSVRGPAPGPGLVPGLGPVPGPAPGPAPLNQ
jgi:polyhydroxyalkanoate synthesis regulator phasin